MPSCHFIQQVFSLPRWLVGQMCVLTIQAFHFSNTCNLPEALNYLWKYFCFKEVHTNYPTPINNNFTFPKKAVVQHFSLALCQIPMHSLRFYNFFFIIIIWFTQNTNMICSRKITYFSVCVTHFPCSSIHKNDFLWSHAATVTCAQLST